MPLRPWSFVATDLDRDGAVDLVVTDQDGLRLVVLRGDGTGAFSVDHERALGVCPQVPDRCGVGAELAHERLRVADLDADGRLELHVGTCAGAINVTVLDASTGARVPMATVMSVGGDDAEVLLGTTNAAGQVVLSARELAAPQNVTACAIDYECSTIEQLSVENMTVSILPDNPSAGGGGVLPVPDARITGTIRGLSDRPEQRDPFVLSAFVDTTHSSPYSRVANPEPGPGGVLSEDGPFDITVRPGSWAAIVTAGAVLASDYEAYRDGALDYWDFHETMLPCAIRCPTAVRNLVRQVLLQRHHTGLRGVLPLREVRLYVRACLGLDSGGRGGDSARRRMRAPGPIRRGTRVFLFQRRERNVHGVQDVMPAAAAGCRRHSRKPASHRCSRWACTSRSPGAWS